MPIPMFKRTKLPAVIAIAVALLAGGCLEDAATGDAGTPGPEVTTDATRQLAELEVRTEDTGAHYDRDDWGSWRTVRGCSTREKVLEEYGDGVVMDDDCRPSCPATQTPCWTSLYDNAPVREPGELQIDHVVPLAEAARSGARTWTADQREDYYNDTANLLPVTVRSNASKSDSDPGEWRPHRSYWCPYAMTYIDTKTRYELTVDEREHAALRSMLNTCRKR